MVQFSPGSALFMPNLNLDLITPQPKVRVQFRFEPEGSGPKSQTWGFVVLHNHSFIQGCSSIGKKYKGLIFLQRPFPVD